MENFRESRIKRRQCPSCEAAIINGTYCHEAGCPDSHLFVKRECSFCGCLFQPEDRDQRLCSPECEEAYRV